MLPFSKIVSLQKLLFRVSRGKLFYSFFSLKNDYENDDKEQDSFEELMYMSLQNLLLKYAQENSPDLTEYCNSVFQKNLSNNGFLILLPNYQKNYLSEKINSLLKLHDAKIFDFPENGDKMKICLNNTKQDILDSLKVFISSKNSLKESICSLQDKNDDQIISNFMLLKSELLSARSLLFQLNKCNQRDNLLEIDFWIPEGQSEILLSVVDSIKKEHSYTAIELQKEDIEFEKPPTYFAESGFFNQFQEIVNTYGIPSYKEINPAVFTSVTFPFLFGVMFGDIAHGSVLFIFSLYLLCNSLSIANNLKINHLTIKSLGITLCFMGFFSMYAGVIYNDFLALPVTVNPSCYELQGEIYGN